MAQETITAIFDTRAEAERAIEALCEAGLPRSYATILPTISEGHADVDNVTSVTGGSERGSHAVGGAESVSEGGFMSALRNLLLPDEDRHSYTEGVRRGAVMIAVKASDENKADGIMDVLEAHGAVDLNEREATWRAEGWAGFGPGPAGSGMMDPMKSNAAPEATVSRPADTGVAAGLASTAAGSGAQDATMPAHSESDRAGSGLASAVGGAASAVGNALSGTSTGSSSDYGSTPTTGSALGATGSTGTAAGTHSAGTSTTGAGERDESIPIVEEQLRVGKRQVEGGRVRVRSYVVETPVQEQVSLRQEHVGVERVPVNRPVTAADQALFQERTVEASATSEEAVVSKEARVVEELRLHKEAEQRTQTVSDTVRRTEVEVDDQTTTGRGTGTDTSRGS